MVQKWSFMSVRGKVIICTIFLLITLLNEDSLLKLTLTVEKTNTYIDCWPNSSQKTRSIYISRWTMTICRDNDSSLIVFDIIYSEQSVAKTFGEK